MPDIVTVGEILVDILADRVGQTFLEPGVFHGPYPSGAPAIFIDQAAHMGCSCGIFAKVGQDDFGALNIARLKRDHVDVSHIVTDPGHTTGTAFATYQADGGRKFIFHFAESAAGYLTPDDLDEDYIAGAKYLHIMGCSISAGPRLSAAISAAVDIAVKHRVPVAFDPNLRPELLHGSAPKKLFDKILAHASVLLTGAGEITALTGCGDAAVAAAGLAAGGKLVVVKNGSRDTVMYRRGNDLRIPPFPAAEVDPTGAGDCFDATFLAALCQGENTENAALLACAAGALAVQKRGPMEGVSAKEEILRLIRSSGRA